jgi:hypothetical protein
MFTVDDTTLALGVICGVAFGIIIGHYLRGDSGKPKAIPTNRVYENKYPQHTTLIKASQGYIFCPYCGRETDETGRFCQWCGGNIVLENNNK